MRASLFLFLVACGGSHVTAGDGGVMCGSAACSDTQFCMHYATGVEYGSVPQGCNALPGTCSSPVTCDCLVSATKSACAMPVVCTGDDAEGFVIDCPL